MQEKLPWFPRCSPTPGIASNIRTRPLFRRTLPGRSNYLDRDACHIFFRPRARTLARALRVEVSASFQAQRTQRTMVTTRMLQPGPPNVSLHTQPQLNAVSHILLFWQGTLSGQWALQLDPYHFASHTQQRNNHTELGERRRARHRLLWSHREPRQAPYFPGTRELLSAQCRWRVPLSHPLPSL